MVSNFAQKNEMADKCNNPTCENELVHVEGRRKKKYCSARCRNKISMGNFLAKPKDKKTIRIPVEKYNDLLAKIAENNKPENKERILEERNTPHNLGEKHDNPTDIKSALKSTKTKKEAKEDVSFEKENDYPIRKEGESSLEYRVRCQEWHQKYGNK